MRGRKKIKQRKWDCEVEALKGPGSWYPQAFPLLSPHPMGLDLLQHPTSHTHVDT